MAVEDADVTERERSCRVAEAGPRGPVLTDHTCACHRRADLDMSIVVDEEAQGVARTRQHLRRLPSLL